VRKALMMADQSVEKKDFSKAVEMVDGTVGKRVEKKAVRLEHQMVVRWDEYSVDSSVEK